MAAINEEDLQEYLEEQRALAEAPEEFEAPVAQVQEAPAQEFTNWDSYTSDPEYQTLDSAEKQELYDRWRQYATNYLASTGNLTTKDDLEFTKSYFSGIAEQEGLKGADYKPPNYAEQLIQQGQSGYRSLESGVAGYGALIGVADTESAANAIAERNRQEQEKYISPEFQEYGNKQLGFFGAVKEIITNPFDLALPFLAQSMGSNLPALASSLGIAGVSGAVAGPAGAASAGLYSSAILGGATDALVTVDQLIKEEVQKRGLNPTDPKAVASVLADPEFKTYAIKYANARGLAIGATGLAAFGLGTILATPAREIAKAGVRGIAGEVGKQIGIQVVSEPVGEVAAQAGAQVATGQPIDIKGREVAEELVVGLPMSGVEAGVLTYKNLVENNAPATADEVLVNQVSDFRKQELERALARNEVDKFYGSLSIGEKAKTLGLAPNAVLTGEQSIFDTLTTEEKQAVQVAFEATKQRVQPPVLAREEVPAQAGEQPPVLKEPVAKVAAEVPPVLEPQVTAEEAEAEAAKAFEQALETTPPAPEVAVTPQEAVREAGAEAGVPAPAPETTAPISEAVQVPLEQVAPASAQAVAEEKAPAPVAEAPAPVVEQPKVEAPAPAPAPAPVQPTTQKLPRNLAGAKPRYGFGSKQFGLTFANDIDRALYIIAQATKSAKDAEYLDFVMKATGLNEAQARAAGRAIRASIKEQAKTSDADTLEVAQSDVTKPKVEAPVAVPVTAPQAVTPPAAPAPATVSIPTGGEEKQLPFFVQVAKSIYDYAIKNKIPTTKSSEGVTFLSRKATDKQAQYTKGKSGQFIGADGKVVNFAPSTGNSIFFSYPEEKQKAPAPAPVTPAPKKLPPTKKQVTALTKLGYLPADIEGLDRVQAKEIIGNQTPKTPTIEAPKEKVEAPAQAGAPAPAVPPAPVVGETPATSAQPPAGEVSPPVAPPASEPTTQTSLEERLGQADKKLTALLEKLGGVLGSDVKLDAASVATFFGGVPDQATQARIESVLKLVNLGLSNVKARLKKAKAAGRNLEETFTNIDKLVFTNNYQGGGGIYADPRNPFEAGTLYINPDQLTRVLMSDLTLNPADFFASMLEEEVIHANHGKAMVRAFVQTFPPEKNKEVYASPAATLEAYIKFYDAQNAEIENSLTIDQIKNVVGKYAQSLGIDLAGKTKEQIVQEFNVGRPGRLAEEYLRALIQGRQLGSITEEQVRGYTTRPILRILGALRNWFRDLVGKGVQKRKTFVDRQHDAILSVLLSSSPTERLAAQGEINTAIPGRILASSIDPFAEELNRLNKNTNAKLEAEIQKEFGPRNKETGEGGLWRRTIIGRLKRSFPAVDPTEVESLVYASIPEAMGSFDEDKGAKFPTYLYGIAQKKILREKYKTLKRRTREVASFQAPGFYNIPLSLKLAQEADIEAEAEAPIESEDLTPEQRAEKLLARAPSLEKELDAQEKVSPVLEEKAVAAAYEPETGRTNLAEEGQELEELTLADGEAISSLDAVSAEKRTAYLEAQLGEAGKLLATAAKALGLTKIETEVLAYAADPDGSILTRKEITDKYGLTNDQFTNMRDDVLTRMREQLGRAGVTRTADVLASSINLFPRYSEAVRANNVEEAQTLVDRAARLNGYNYGPVYHGSPVKNISQFRPSRNTVNQSYFHDYGPGIYVTNDQQYAREYTTPRGLLIDSILAGQDLRGEEGKVYKVYAKLSNPLEIKGEGIVPQNIYSAFRERVQQRGSETAKEMLNDLYPEGAEGGFSFADILSEELASFMVNTLKNFGYDGIIAEDGREVVVWDPAQLKSADPFTYDENNQLIPLKDRFNVGSPLLASSIDPTRSQALARAKTTLPADVAAEIDTIIQDPFTDAGLTKLAKDFVKANSPNGDVMHAKRILDGRPNMKERERLAVLGVIGVTLRKRVSKVNEEIKKKGSSPERLALKNYLDTNLREVFIKSQQISSEFGQNLRSARTNNALFLPYHWEGLYTGPIGSQQEELLRTKQEVIKARAEIERLLDIISGDAVDGIYIKPPESPDDDAKIGVGDKPIKTPLPEGENFYELLSLFGDMSPTEGETFSDYLQRLGVNYDDVVSNLEGMKAASVSPAAVTKILPEGLKSLSAKEAIRKLVAIDKNFFGKLVALRIKSGGGTTEAQVAEGLDRKRLDVKDRPAELQTVFDFFGSTESTKPTSEAPIEKDILPPLVRLAKYAADTITDRVMRSLGADKAKMEKGSFEKLERQVRALVNAQFRQETNPIQASKEDTRSVEQRLLDMVQRIQLAETVFNDVKAKLQAEIIADNRAKELKAETQLSAKERADLEARANRLFNPNAINSLDSLLRKTIDFKAEARKHMSQRGASVESLTEVIKTKFPGFTPAQAESLGKFLSSRYARILKESGERQLLNITRRLGEKATAMPKGKMQQLLELINLGAFDEEKFYNAIAERYDIPDWDPAIAEEIRRQADVLQSLPLGSDQQATATFQLQAYIAQKVNEQKRGWARLGRNLDVAASVWKAGVLSGFPTQIVNLGATHLNVLFELLAEANAYKKLAKTKGKDAKFGDFFKTGLIAYWDAVGRVGVEQASDAFSTGLTRFRNEKQIELSPLEVFKFDTDKTWTLNNYIAAWKIVGRAMAGADTYNSVIANEAKARMAARYALLTEGLTAEEATKRTQEIFDRNSATSVALQEQVNREEAEEQFGSLAGLDPKSSAYRSTKRNIEAGKRRRFEQLRDETIAKESKLGETGMQAIRDFTQKATFNNRPEGLIGYIGGEIVGALAGKVPLLTPFAAFPRTIANIINSGLNYTPYGYARAYGFSIGNMFDIIRTGNYAFKAPEQGSVEFHKLQAQAFWGSIVAFTLIGLALRDIDEDWDDAFFAVTGRGPADAEQREQLRASGWTENTVKFGSLRFKHTDFPGLNTIFGAMALVSDMYRYGNLKEEDLATIATTAAMSIGNSIFDKQLLSGAKTLFEAVSDRGNSSDKAKRLIQSYTGGFLNPGFARWMTKTFNIGADGMVGVVDYKELNSTTAGWLMGLTPMAVVVGKPELNRLGEPIREYPYTATMKRFGFVPEVKEHPVFSPLVKAGLFVPGASIGLKIKDFEKGKVVQRKMDREEFYNYSKYNGEYLRRRLTPQKAQALARLASRSPEVAQKELEKLAGDAREYGKNRIEQEIRIKRRRK